MNKTLACGLPLRIYIRRSYNKIDEEEVSKIKESLNKYIDIKHYKVFYNEDIMELTLDKKIFNDNIHQTLIEVKELLSINSFLRSLFYKEGKKLKIDYKEFNQKNYPIIYDIYNDENESYSFIYSDDKEDCIESHFTNSFWHFYDKDLKGYDISIEHMPIWDIFDSYIQNDESFLLYILNKMKQVYYKGKNELTSDLLYYVVG